MNEPENIKQFKEMSAVILGTLYATHPIAQWYDAETFLSEKTTPNNTEELFIEAANFLIENGYIVLVQKGFLRLRDKGYEALNKPNPLNPKQSVGSGLATWVKGTASDISKDSISKLVTHTLQSLFFAFNTTD